MIRLRAESQRLPRRLLTEYMANFIKKHESRGISGQSEVKIFDTYANLLLRAGWANWFGIHRDFYGWDHTVAVGIKIIRILFYLSLVFGAER